MASGLLGKAALAANADTVIYTAPAKTVASATINFCNTSNYPIGVRLSVGMTAVPAAADYLEYEFMIPSNGVLERTGVVLAAGEIIVCRAGQAGVVVQARGFEEPA